MRITTFHTFDGVTYKGHGTLRPLYDSSGAGFTFYPYNGTRIRCKIPNDSNHIFDRATGKVIGEYNVMWKHAVLVLEETR